MKNRKLRLIIYYRSFMMDNSRCHKYTIFEPVDYGGISIKHGFDSKYELLIWLDMNNLKLGRYFYNRDVKEHFERYAGKVFRLIKKKV